MANNWLFRLVEFSLKEKEVTPKAGLKLETGFSFISLLLDPVIPLHGVNVE